MKKIKILSLVLFVVMLTNLISGCSKTAVTSGDKKEARKMTITWMGIPYNPSAHENTFPEKLLEEKFNIDIKPIFLDTGAYKTKKPIMLSSNEIPDLIYELDPLDVQADIAQGFLSEVPYETIKKYAPTVYKQLNDTVPEAWLFSESNGKNYGVPNINYAGNTPRLGIWRTDWLHNVGITKIPETLDEMHTALLKFTNEDPDRNGKKDTYGMSGDVKSYYTSFTEIFGAYGIIPFDWMEKDGKLVYGGTLPENKQVINLLKNWYKEGIIHPDFTTDSVYTNGRDRFVNGEVGYINNGGVYGINAPENPSSLISTMKKINPNATIEIAKLPKGPENKSGTYSFGMAGHVICFGRQLENNPEKLAKVLEIMEAMLTDQDFSLKLRVGEKGVHWDYQDKTIGESSGIKFLPPYDDRNQADNECLKLVLGMPSFYAVIPSSLELINRFADKKVQESTRSLYDPKLALVDALQKSDTVPSASKFLGDLRNKQIQMIMEIILSGKSADSYDDFIKTWGAMGGNTLEKEANDMQNEKKSILEKLK